jgi:hypothetical protein
MTVGQDEAWRPAATRQDAQEARAACWKHIGARTRPADAPGAFYAAAAPAARRAGLALEASQGLTGAPRRPAQGLELPRVQDVAKTAPRA